VRELHRGLEDTDILPAISMADRTAIDAPFGWPEPFVEFVASHRAGSARAPEAGSGLEWRRTLMRRATDLWVAENVGVPPLSVSADRIAAVAMRAAGLLGRMTDAGLVIDRAGFGEVVETYPAAALKRWGLPHKGYKTAHNARVLDALVDELIASLRGLDLGDYEELCRSSDDAFDAVICALVARAAFRPEGTFAPPVGKRRAASSEGWIRVPAVSVAQLIDQEP
jgi:predicted nuclease with RNAse H fold